MKAKKIKMAILIVVTVLFVAGVIGGSYRFAQAAAASRWRNAGERSAVSEAAADNKETGKEDSLAGGTERTRRQNRNRDGSCDESGDGCCRTNRDQTKSCERKNGENGACPCGAGGERREGAPRQAGSQGRGVNNNAGTPETEGRGRGGNGLCDQSARRARDGSGGKDCRRPRTP